MINRFKKCIVAISLLISCYIAHPAIGLEEPKINTGIGVSKSDNSKSKISCYLLKTVCSLITVCAVYKTYDFSCQNYASSHALELLKHCAKESCLSFIISDCAIHTMANTLSEQCWTKFIQQAQRDLGFSESQKKEYLSKYPSYEKFISTSNLKSESLFMRLALFFEAFFRGHASMFCDNKSLNCTFESTGIDTGSLNKLYDDSQFMELLEGLPTYSSIKNIMEKKGK